MINGMHRIWTVAFFVAIVAALPVVAKKKDDSANLRSAYIVKVQQASSNQPIQRTLGSLWSRERHSRRSQQISKPHA